MDNQSHLLQRIQLFKQMNSCCVCDMIIPNLIKMEVAPCEFFSSIYTVV